MMWDDWNAASSVMVLFMALTWLVVICGGLWLLAAVENGSWRGSQRDEVQDAQELLDQRLARGEIDVDEYEERSRALREPRV